MGKRISQKSDASNVGLKGVASLSPSFSEDSAFLPPIFLDITTPSGEATFVSFVSKEPHFLRQCLLLLSSMSPLRFLISRPLGSIFTYRYTTCLVVRVKERVCQTKFS